MGKKTPLEKELELVKSKEEKYLNRNGEKKDSLLNRKLEEKVPEKLQSTLNAAFSKAFSLIFEKGTGVIEKTYSKEKKEQDVKIREYAARVKDDRRSLKEFSRSAGRAGGRNLLLSSAEGIGLGVLGIGLPDIPLFTGVLLRSMYETAMEYGYDYNKFQEKYFILLLIQGALSYGEDLQKINAQVDAYLERGVLPEGITLRQQIDGAASALSGELLYMKFLQGIPIVGAVGGAFDGIYLKRILDYSQLKYRKRFLLDYKKKDSITEQSK